MDGSAKDFVEKILDTGLINQKMPQKIIQIKKKVNYKTIDKYIEISPNKKKLTIDYSIDYKPLTYFYSTDIKGKYTNRNLVK